jgi:hypothetical protein
VVHKFFTHFNAQYQEFAEEIYFLKSEDGLKKLENFLI